MALTSVSFLYLQSFFQFWLYADLLRACKFPLLYQNLLALLQWEI